MTDLGTALEVARQPQEVRTVLDLIEGMKPELEKSLQSDAAALTLTRHYYTAVRYNPKLLECTADSLVGALLLSAQMRLEPGPLGHVSLVPFKNHGVHECVWMLGYTGMIELGRRGGATGLRSTVVWEGDDYEPPWENEKGLHWRLKPAPLEERGDERVGVLVVWKEQAERVAHHCPPSRIDTALKASPMEDVSRRNEDWYWRKTGVRFVRPWLPLSPDFARAASVDESAVHGIEVDQLGAAQPAIDAPAFEEPLPRDGGGDE